MATCTMLPMWRPNLTNQLINSLTSSERWWNINAHGLLALNYGTVLCGEQNEKMFWCIFSEQILQWVQVKKQSTCDCHFQHILYLTDHRNSSFTVELKGSIQLLNAMYMHVIMKIGNASSKLKLEKICKILDDYFCHLSYRVIVCIFVSSIDKDLSCMWEK